MKGRFEVGQGFQRGVGARAFVGGKDRFRDGWLSGFCAGNGDRDRHRDEFLGKAACSLRGQSFLVAGERKGVLIFAGDLVAAGDALGGKPHGQQG